MIVPSDGVNVLCHWAISCFPIKIRSRAKAKVNILEPMYLYMFFQVTDIIQSFSTAKAIASKSVPLRVQDKITLATDVTTEIIIGIINLYTSKFTTVFLGMKSSISCSCIPSHTKDSFLGAHVRSCRGLQGTA